MKKIENMMDQLLEARWTEQNRALIEEILLAKKAMRQRGIFLSSLTVQAIHELFRKELLSSADNIIRTLGDFFPPNGNVNKSEIEIWGTSSFDHRRDALNTLFMKQTSALCSSLSNKGLIAPYMTINQYHGLVSRELKISIDAAVVHHENLLGRTVTDRVINGFKNKPVVAFVIIFIMAVTGIYEFMSIFNS